MSKGEKKDPDYTWHYTSEKGKKGIEESGKINPSRKRDGDIAYGEKVYLTKLHPEENKAYDIAMNNYDGTPEQARSRLPDTKYAIGFPSKDINPKREPDRRDIYTVDRELPVDKAKVWYKQEEDGSYKKITSASKQK